jgi:hypothetical protein
MILTVLFWVIVVLGVLVDIFFFCQIGMETFEAIGYAMVLQIAGIWLGACGLMPLAWVAILLATAVLVYAVATFLRHMVSRIQDL